MHSLTAWNFPRGLLPFLSIVDLNLFTTELLQLLNIHHLPTFVATQMLHGDQRYGADWHRSGIPSNGAANWDGGNILSFLFLGAYVQTSPIILLYVKYFSISWPISFGMLTCWDKMDTKTSNNWLQCHWTDPVLDYNPTTSSLPWKHISKHDVIICKQVISNYY